MGLQKIKNKDRFDILQGYYQNKEFHPSGGSGVGLNDFLHKIGFEKLEDFLIWYKSLTPREIKDGKKNWCPGKCCQSNLIWLRSGKVLK